MKKVLLSIPLLVLITILVLSAATPALAGQLYHSKGTGADAYWLMYDQGTGVYTDIFVYGRDSMYQDPPGRPQAKEYGNISIFQYRYDEEEFVPLVDISYWGAIPEGGLAIDNKLASASVVASDLAARKWDYLAEEETAVSLDVDVNWMATGSLSRESYSWHHHFPYMNANYHYSGKSRGATAQGSVHYDGISIILGASDGGRIFYTREGLTEVNR